MQGIQTIKILVADPQPIVRKGVSAILQSYPDFEIVEQTESGEDILTNFEQYKPDIVALDIDLHGQRSGIEMINILLHKSPPTRIVVLTNNLEEMVIHNALREGAISYLLKNISPDDLAEAIRAAYQGIPTLSPEVTQILIQGVISPVQTSPALTPREYQVLNLISRGWNNHAIAEELSISSSTVQFHVSNILTKLDVHNRIEAATFAVRHRITSSNIWPGVYH